MADVVKIISSLGVDASGVFAELDKVKAKYGETTTEVRKQEDEIQKLMKQEENLQKLRAQTNSPSIVAQFNNEIKKTQAEISKLNAKILEQKNGMDNISKSGGKLSTDLNKAFDTTKVKSLNSELKNSQDGADKLGKKVTDDVGKKGEKAIESLTARIKALKIEIAQATDPEEAARLTEEAGKLQNKLNDINSSVNILSSGSKFETLGKSIKEVGSKILSLDFEGALKNSEIFLKTSKQITFKETIEAVKNVGSSLSNVGRALLTNPLVLIGGVILGIIEVTKDLIETEKKYTEVLDHNAEAIGEVVEATQALVRANRDLAIENEVSSGRISKSQGERLKNQNEFKDAFIAIAKEQAAAEKKLNDEITKVREEDGFRRTKQLFEFLGGETEATRIQKNGLLEIQQAFDKKREELRIRFGLKNTSDLIGQAKAEYDIIKKLTQDVLALRDKNSLALFDDKTIQGVQDQAKKLREIAVRQNAFEREENLKDVTDSEKRNKILSLEAQKLSAEIVAINKQEKDKIKALKKERIEENKTLNDQVIRDEADLHKSLLELAIENAELDSNKQVDSYSSRYKLTFDYYNALISLTKENSSERILLEAQLTNELLKIDKEHQREVFELKNAEIAEEERHVLALLNINGKNKVIQLATEIHFENEKLRILKESGIATEAEIKAQNNKIEELNAELNKEIERQDKEKLKKGIDNIKTLVDATLAGAKQIIDAEIKRTDALINAQQRRVDEATRLAEKGNAELLELEKKRLDDLNKEKEKFVRAQQALAVIELIANTAVTVSKAAAEGGAGAAITIAAALAALIAGLAASRSIAGQAAFYEGGEYSGQGYTGDGNPRESSRKVGRKPYDYHYKEYIFNHQTTGKYLNHFRDIHSGKMDLNDTVKKAGLYDAMKVNGIDIRRDVYLRPLAAGMGSDISSLKGELRDVKQAIEGQERLSVVIDENGIAAIASRFIAKQKKINSLTR